MSPTQVAKEGVITSSISPPTPFGFPIRTGKESILLAASSTSTVSAPPPVTTTPDGTRLVRPTLSSSSLTMVKISFKRGLIIPSTKVLLETFLTSGIPRLSKSNRSLSSFAFLPFLATSERKTFIFSADSKETLSPIAKSLVTFLAPIGITPEYVISPSIKAATEVVPPPISTTTTPSSRSVEDSTASADANPENTNPSISIPISLTAFLKFFIAAEETVIMCVSTSSLTPLIPTASFTPASPSTINSLGTTCITSREEGRETADAPSITLSTSSPVISPSGSDTATTPCEF